MLELTGPIIAEIALNGCSGAGKPFMTGFTPEDKGTLSLSRWEKILQRLDGFIHDYRITGGEPLDNPLFFDILDMLEKSGKFYHVFTSGIWNDTGRILDGLTGYGRLTSMTFGIQGHNAETHNSFTNLSDDDTFGNILKNLHHTCSAGINVNTNTILTRDNFEHIEEIAEMAMDMGAGYSVFSRNIAPLSDRNQIDSTQLKSACLKIESLKEMGYNVILGNCIPHCLFSSGSSGCVGGFTYSFIDWQGNLYPCRYSSTTPGSLLDSDLKSLWRSRELREWRKRIPAPCKKCEKLQACSGACRVMADRAGKAEDPFMGEPVKKNGDSPLLEVTLEEELCPIPRYVTRPEDFGWILIRDTRIIPVSRKAEKILKIMDGKTNLGYIQKKFGDGALSFIYSLYLRNFVEFRTKEHTSEK